MLSTGVVSHCTLVIDCAIKPRFKGVFETAVNCGKVKTINVIKRPSVMFTDSDNVNMPIFKKSAFAIFDVPPLSYRAYVGSNGTAEYVLIDGKDPTSTNRRFVLDCLKVADRYEFQLVTKLKREDPRLDKKYIELLKALESQGRLTILSPEISPARVYSIRDCRPACLSLLWVIIRNFRKTSVSMILLRSSQLHIHLLLAFPLFLGLTH